MTRRNVSDVTSHIRQMIRNGTWNISDRLPPSRHLAMSLGTARNTLRDALLQLQNEGLIETRPGSGSYVTAIPNSNLPLPNAVRDATPLELIDTRFALEPHVCRLCVLNARREDLDDLKHLCDSMEQSVDDPINFAANDARFHTTLATATRNTLIIWIIEQINAVRACDEWTRMRQLTLNPDIIQTYNSQHRNILNAIIAREPERAATAMKTHLETARLSLTRSAET